MKKIRVPIFTEEYAVNVYIGKQEEVIKNAAKYMKCSEIKVKNQFHNKRGMAWNCFPEWHPLIGINGELSATIALATLAHESSHTLDFIIHHIGLDDRSGEFRAHGIACIMRTVGKSFKK